VLRVNRKAEELFGWEPGELVGRPGLVFYPDERAYAALGAEAGPVLARGEAFLSELELRRKDGTRFWARVAAKAVNPRATGDGTIWIVEDITERRRAAESLNRLLRELSTILDTATVGIAYSRNRMLLRCNRKLEELFGYAPGELVGRSTALLYPSDDAFERFGADAFPVIESGGTYEAEVPHLRRDGTPILCHVSGRAIDPADIAQGLIWIVQDVRHAAQEALVCDHSRRRRARSPEGIELRWIMTALPRSSCGCAGSACSITATSCSRSPGATAPTSTRR
jgi:PAS domain S-box-containing protein